MTKLTLNSIDEYLDFLEQIGNDSRFEKMRYVLDIGENGDVLAKAVAGDLGLKLITQDEILFYRVNEVLIVIEKTSDLSESYAEHKYLVKIMK